MILSFRHNGLEAFFGTGSVAGIQPIHTGRLRELLTALNAAMVHRIWRARHGDCIDSPETARASTP